MNQHEFDGWLKTYGAVWEAKEAEAVAALFTDDEQFLIDVNSLCRRNCLDRRTVRTEWDWKRFSK